ncbi:hypothetical protein HK102_008746, partial [Quaeritorhiza haematococci]
NNAEGVVSVYFGLSEDSISLLFFGLDSFVEVGSAFLVLWRLFYDLVEVRRAWGRAGGLVNRTAAGSAGDVESGKAEEEVGKGDQKGESCVKGCCSPSAVTISEDPQVAEITPETRTVPSCEKVDVPAKPKLSESFIRRERYATIGIGLLFILLAVSTIASSIITLVRRESPDTTVAGLIVSG